MKKWLLPLLLFSQLLFAQAVPVNCASATLGQTYSTSAPSLQTVLKAIPVGTISGHLSIGNPTSVSICATATTSTTAPAVGNALEHCIPPTSIQAWDWIALNPNTVLNVFLRADQANCTTGVFYPDIW